VAAERTMVAQIVRSNILVDMAKPVINHDGLPTKSVSFVKINDPNGRKQFYPSLMQLRKPVALFPEDCIIDTAENMVCKILNDELVAIESAGWSSGSDRRGHSIARSTSSR
jgi:hypothetical protein